LCFLDGAKQDNVALLQLCIPRTRTGGVILVDNAFRGGRLGAESDDPDDRATLEALDFARISDQLEAVVLPIADGILACRRV
jgi:caffeoyl-CoA O-methyltransferase